MKKVIDRKVYDTETAILIAEYSNYTGSFTDYEEALYKTHNGRWFIAGKGGPMSQYSQPYGNNGRSGGSNIFRISSDDALAWLESHQLLQKIEEYFPEALEEA